MSRGDREDRVGHRRSGRFRHHRVVSERDQGDGEVAADLFRPGPEAADPAPHSVLRPPQLGRDPPMPQPSRGYLQTRPDHLRGIRTPRPQHLRQQHVGGLASSAPGPTRPDLQPRSPKSPDLPRPPVSPRRQPGPAPRAGQLARPQLTFHQHDLDVHDEHPGHPFTRVRAHRVVAHETSRDCPPGPVLMSTVSDANPRLRAHTESRPTGGSTQSSRPIPWQTCTRGSGITQAASGAVGIDGRLRWAAAVVTAEGSARPGAMSQE